MYPPLVYLNGAFLPAAEARVSPFDRGFVFADGVYEVIPVYGRRMFRMRQHLKRLDDSLAGIRVRNPLASGEWEQIFRRLGDEVPYRTTVGIESFEHEGDARRIHAVVWVDRPGQRAILLGQGGETMKTIATEARKSMVRLFGGSVHLEVWVRVKKGWADDDATLAKLGF